MLQRLQGEYGAIKVEVRDGELALQFLGRWYEVDSGLKSGVQLQTDECTSLLGP